MATVTKDYTILTKSREGTITIDTDQDEEKGFRIDPDKENWDTPNYNDGIVFQKKGIGAMQFFIPEIGASFVESPTPPASQYELSPTALVMPVQPFYGNVNHPQTFFFVVNGGDRENSVKDTDIQGLLEPDNYTTIASKSTPLCLSFKKTQSADITLTAKVYYSDGSTSTKTLFTVSSEANEIYNFQCGFNELGLSDPNNSAEKFELSTIHNSVTVFLKTEFQQTFCFLNKFGGFSNLVCWGEYQDELKTTKEKAVIDVEYNQLIEVFNSHTKKYRTISTGYGVNWEVVQGFLESEAVYTYINNEWKKVIIDVDSVKSEQQYTPGVFTFKYSDDVQT
ncbi:hypothetical protein [Flammeovirga aprica]|uniref:Uncharacterized protein n=1 Tax=Flammeovirga aprica JL-4 TaxID=694437 RepID=A0A7X9P0Y2_9BACT|nr:hypothetical protein [Flammeovirga aprica]NME67213.1 hypothetical protein [Flammeovirga aprica JL-4]